MITWQSVPGAIGYAIVKNGSVVAFTTSTSYNFSELGGGSYCIRVANACGGLGEPSSVITGMDGIIAGETLSDEGNTYNTSGQRVGTSFKGIVVKKGKKYVQR